MLRLPLARTFIRIAASCWLLTVAIGMAMLSAYAGTPGTPASPPEQWPVASTISHRAGIPTILVFAHPNCPCTRATLGEVDWLLAHVATHPDVHVLLLQPADADRARIDDGLAQLAASIPTVQVAWDAGGREAERFGVATSGQVLLYDGADRLRFAGGITGARGHAGANPGRDTLLLHLTDATTATGSAPVFGCGFGSAPSS